ncbi:uncharacterized protein EV422DRAFT_524684 [Fimicolochytrium jonesii]|uniref:uncharacterized protein n=1 Tax=Fimicolochytrium jonesii TaxID=1396493 RepID=UPI0022FEB77C|nr:uncharacterized protein EV422DRAFT_524684 [Fimicolochytrium jonesii]KAI8822601.1 hypothetical protein EV422DRAFT_524684 [Fimicolochytrium jonesii]
MQGNNSGFNYRPPPAWRGGGEREGGGGGAAQNQGRRGGSRPFRGRGGGDRQNNRHQPYPAQHYQRQQQQQFSGGDGVSAAQQAQQYQQPQLLQQQYLAGQDPQNAAYPWQQPQQAYYQPLQMDQSGSIPPQQTLHQQQQLLLQQQQQQVQQRNLAMLPTLLAMAGQLGTFLTHQQQQQQLPMQQQSGSYGYADPSSIALLGSAAMEPYTAAAQTKPPAPFSCENCEKTFEVESQYRTHCKQHVKCSECEFEASKKVVRGHEEEVHAIVDGVKRTFVSKDTPEEIAQWIQERKKKYPTEANIRAKTLAEQERHNRGDVIREPKGLKGNRKERGPLRQMHVASTPVVEVKREEPIKNGLGLLTAYASDISSDAEELAPTEGADPLSTTPKPDPTSDASSLSSSDSSDDDEEEATAPTPDAAHPTPQRQPRSMPICKYFLRNRCTKGDSCAFRHERPPPKTAEQKEAANARRAAASSAAAAGSRRPLLKMLLEADIRKEQNTILQCVRYIVQKDFFETKNQQQTEQMEP